MVRERAKAQSKSSETVRKLCAVIMMSIEPDRQLPSVYVVGHACPG